MDLKGWKIECFIYDRRKTTVSFTGNNGELRFAGGSATVVSCFAIVKLGCRGTDNVAGHSQYVFVCRIRPTGQYCRSGFL